MNIIKQYSPDSIALWETEHFIPVDAFLHDEYPHVVQMAVQLVCSTHNIPFTVLKTKRSHQNILKKASFELKKASFSLFLAVHNFVSTFAKKKKQRKILVTDYWRNVAPYIDGIEDTQVIFFDRKEFFNVPKKYINKFQMKFKNADGYRRSILNREASKFAGDIFKNWNAIKSNKNLFKDVLFQGIPLEEILISLSEKGVLRAKKDFIHIESLFRLLQDERPDVVVVRASASRQIHFAALCLLAKQLNIPSVEPQHGLFYLGPGSVPKHSKAQYLATYGPLASAELKEVGFEGKLVDVGSPRFDVYASLAPSKVPDSGEMTVLFVLPDDTTGTWFDTYDIEDLITSVANLAASDPKIAIILKSRAGAPVAEFGYKMALNSLSQYSNVVIERNAPLWSLIEKSHVVVSVFSTILVEAMAAKRVVVYWKQKGFHGELAESHMKPYIVNGACLAAGSDSDLKNVLQLLREEKVYSISLEKNKVFSKNNFSFNESSAKSFSALVSTNK